MSSCADSPHIVSLEPSGSVSGQVGASLSLACRAEANPGPAYQWVQKLHDQIVIRGNSRVLVLDNIIFEDDGEYICHAHNVIRGEERITQSAPVHVTVTGPPRLYLDPDTRFETVAGADTSLEAKVCGEPRPAVQWRVDHLVLAAGSGHGEVQLCRSVTYSNWRAQGATRRTPCTRWPPTTTATYHG